MWDALDPAPGIKPNRAWPMLRSFRGYRASFLAGDLVAGLSLAAIAIPAQMATAHLGGFPPQIGFFAFLAGTLGFAAFGDNRFLCCCADSTITPIFAGSLALLVAAGSKEYALYTAALALMVGLTLIAAGLFRLGRIGDLLSIPVTIGFLVGIAAHIVISQLPGVLGAPAPIPQRGADILGYLGAVNPFTLTIALGEFAMLLVLERLSARIPAALIGLVLATCAVFFFRLDAHGVAVLGTVPSALPVPSIPVPSAANVAELVPLALIVAIIVMVQTAATTRSFPSDPDKPPNVDRDFVGVGVGSMLAGLFGTFPVDASPPTTEIVAASGGRSQLACLIAAAILLILLLFGAALLRHVPQAALAGVLLFVALKIVRADQIATIYRQSRPEFLLIVATAAAIIFLPIGEGVAIGIWLSLIHGIWSTASGKIIVFERVPGTTIWWPPTQHQRGERLAGVAVIGFDAPLSFLNADRFRGGVSAVLQSMSVKLIVLEANGISQIDFTAAATLREIIRECHANEIDFAIARLESIRAQEAARRLGLDSVLGPDHIFRSVEEAVKALAADAQVVAS
ncbi:MAG TPA: SulP family inorganic anion transporter [Methylovirgula sp.]|nr:SulP family inorganic anion transporter [Methylovirgula sp.]